MMAVFPLMAAAVNENQRLADITRRAVHYLSLMAAPIVLGVIVLSPEAIILIGGHEFAQAWLPLALLMVGNYFVYQSTAYGNFLLATNRQNIILRVTATTLIFNFATNLILIPLAGAAGAATSVLLAELLQFVILLTYYLRHMHIQESFTDRFIPLLNGASMAIVVYGSKLYLEHHHVRNALVLLISVAVGAAVYGVLVLITKQLRLGELKEMLGRA
jgi:O-antigen/teichoic acid export membrane protein